MYKHHKNLDRYTRKFQARYGEEDEVVMELKMN